MPSNEIKFLFFCAQIRSIPFRTVPFYFYSFIYLLRVAATLDAHQINWQSRKTHVNTHTQAYTTVARWLWRTTKFQLTSVHNVVAFLHRRLRWTKLLNESMYIIILFATQSAVGGIRVEYWYIITVRFIFFSLEYYCLLVCFDSFVLLLVHTHTHSWRE